ncbi:DNA polymerase I [hydrothermal vent metagenome]|uniref:DNA-directed DNA polymerase n=1 Tax=hydrothermal vent metagenome TaxID=652676 RepID=A0A3B0UUF1_9ZZZZ
MPKKTKDTKKKRIVLLDAHAIIHRAYHALPDFTSPTGQPTGALYGIVTMLVKIANELSPDYVSACYDLPKPTIRHEAYEGYKATRQKSDDALTNQIERSRDLFEAFSIPIYEREGFEADDILGTIAHLLKGDKNIEIIIASGDMDTLQLVDKKRVQVYTLKKGINDTILYDEDAVENRFGFSPELIPDYKGLRGDPSDNIIGVPGIGEKTATILVTNFGTVENLYKILKKDEDAFIKVGIKPRIIKLLKEHKDDALFSKTLATIRTDAPIAFSLPANSWSAMVHLDTIFTLFDELGFRNLRDRVHNLFANNTQMEAQEDEHETENEYDIDPVRFAEAGVMLWLLASDFTNPSLEDILAYAKTRSFNEAYEFLSEKVSETGRLKELYENIERPLISVIDKMEKRGIRIDTKTLTGLSEKYHKTLSEVEGSIYKKVGHEFNVNSPKQLGEVLFDELALKPKNQKRTSTGQRSTRESELEKLRDVHPIISDILLYREVQKLLSTYIDNLPPMLDTENRLHAKFIQTGTTTGRMASQNPNLQNIPLHSERGRAIRHAFVASKGCTLVSFDYSQIELRLSAILSGDEKLLSTFRNGRDVHREVASHVFGVAPENVDSEMRRRAKVINFGILYGMGVNALKAQLGTTTAEAHKFYEDYFQQFPQLAEYLERTKGFARKHGYTETLFGRRRQFSEMKSSLPYVRAQAERMAINAPIQGTEADIIKLAMVRIDNALNVKNEENIANLLLQVHDELVYEIKDDYVNEISDMIRERMESILTLEQTLGVPLLVDGKSGFSWGDMTPIII